MWDKLKQLFGAAKPRPDVAPEPAPADRSKLPQQPFWVASANSRWNVRVADLRPFALSVVSTSKDPRMAANAVSYGGEDGTSFATQQPPSPTVTECQLRYRIDRALVDGVLFQPTAMEDKWALYAHDGRISCVRSWQRLVQVAAAVRIEGSEAIVGPITGTFDDREPPDATIRQLDFLLRSHALEEVIPAPLDSSLPADLEIIKVTCFGLWGRRAQFATYEAMPASSPSAPLRTHSVLHIAIARGDRGAVERHLTAGAPIDLLARDGLATLHWALASKDPGMLAWLIERGCPVDVRSTEQATALMNAVQGRSLDQARTLIERGADVDARDHRGFTALHRAAEMGELTIVDLLLAHGVDIGVTAAGVTALSLARDRNHADIVARLSRA